jgi:replicative DNA helicase
MPDVTQQITDYFERCDSEIYRMAHEADTKRDAEIYRMIDEADGRRAPRERRAKPGAAIKAEDQRKEERRSLERAILASVLSDPSEYPHIAAKVRPEYFVDGLCRRILEAQGTLYQENIEPGTGNILASGKLSHDDSSELMDIVVGQEDRLHLPMLTVRLCELEADERVKAANRAADKERDIFKSLALRRDGLTAAESVLQGAIRKSKRERINEVLLRASERASGKRKPFATGFPTIDGLLSGGLSEAGLSFLGGYAGEGKTSLALAITIHTARQGVKTEFLEGEMPEDELHDRAARMLYDGNLVAWLEEYERLPLDILTLTDRTPGRLLASVEYAVVNGGRFVVVDYLQSFAQMQTETDRHYLAIKNLSAQLRSLILRHAEKGNMCHVMALSNLNRTEAGSGRPGLSSLYGSSGLAHDCTEAFMIYSDSSEHARMQEALAGQRTVTVEIAKVRNGQRGPVPFTFYGASQRFEEERGARYSVLEDSGST